MSVNNELKKGIFISAIGKYSNYLIQFIILAILSRLLTPHEFGIVALVNVILTFFTMIIDFGLGPAIIQNKTFNTEQFDGIFSFSILFSLALSIIFGLLSKPIAAFYSSPELVMVCIMMSFTLFTSGINMIPQAILLKQKRFLEVNLAQVFSNIAYGVIGIVLALDHFSYYSLVISSIAKNIVLFLILFYKSRLKLGKRVSWHDLKSVLSFSKNLFLFNSINYFSRNLDNILIGKFISVKALAFYDKAYVLLLYPTQILSNVITPVIQPIMAQFEDQKDVIKKTYLSISTLLAIVGMPLSVFLFFSSKEVIFILFGSQWGGSVMTFHILSLSIWIQVILASTGSIFQSANRTDLLLYSGMLSAAMMISSIIVGVITGKIEYVALIILLAFVVNFIQANYLLMRRVFESKQWEFYKIFKGPLIISIMMAIPLVLIQKFLVHMPVFALFVIKAAISLIVFLIGMKLTGNLNVLLRLLKREKKSNHSSSTTTQ